MNKIYQQGQAVLIVLLVVAVALGFGLSIISQSITDVQISGSSEESVRAFNAAEAGIEEALTNLSGLIGLEGGGHLDVNNILVDYSVKSANYIDTVVRENDVLEVSLLGTVADNLTINWIDIGNNSENLGTCTGVSGQAPASLLISVFDNSGGVSRTAINACDLNSTNGFINVGTVGEAGYLRQYSLAVTANDKRVTIRPIYNQAKIKVVGGSLPEQNYIIDSLAQSPTQESKAIQVSRSVAVVPSIFDYVLFSGGNITR